MYLTSAFAAAVLLDALLGDPARMPHPVRWIGRVISFLERRLYDGGLPRRLAGVVLVSIVVGGVFGSASGILRLAAGVSFRLAWLIEAWLLFTCFAMRSLWSHSMQVARALDVGDLAGARLAVGRIVGRDTEHLSQPEIVRAAVESVAESGVDGVLSPLLCALIGGAPLALSYKAVNTLDSMLGYRSARYLQFGWAAARLDDVVNYLPARLAGGLLVVSAWLSGRGGRASWRVLLRDHARHPSPNAGFPESAVAGALGVQLGGMSAYQGAPSEKPTLGDDERPLMIADIRAANLMVLMMALIAIGGGLGIRLAVFGR